MAAEPTSKPIGASQTEEKAGSMDARTEEIEHSGNLVYENTEEEPELHMKTYIALAAMFMLNMVQLVALQGPPTLVRADTVVGLAFQPSSNHQSAARQYRHRLERHRLPDVGGQRPRGRSSSGGATGFFCQ